MGPATGKMTDPDDPSKLSPQEEELYKLIGRFDRLCRNMEQIQQGWPEWRESSKGFNDMKALFNDLDLKKQAGQVTELREKLGNVRDLSVRKAEEQKPKKNDPQAHAMDQKFKKALEALRRAEGILVSLADSETYQSSARALKIEADGREYERMNKFAGHPLKIRLERMIEQFIVLQNQIKNVDSRLPSDSQLRGLGDQIRKFERETAELARQGEGR